VLVAVWLGEDEKVWETAQSALFYTTRVFLWPHGRRGLYIEAGKPVFASCVWNGNVTVLSK
jgi:hypothetical protein